MTAIEVPSALRENVRAAWGDAGRRWLRRLPALLEDVSAGWELDVGEPYALSFNWVAPARRADGTPAVLKLGVPESDHLSYEAEALACFAGRGAVRLLDRDAPRGALLLQRAEPGSMLRELVPERDDEATAIVVDVLRRLHEPAPDGARLPDLSRHAVSFRRHLAERPDHPALPRSLVTRAAGLFDELVASATERVVLHGDLHHDNVLLANSQAWMAIDPHGEVGDPGYDIAPLLYNPEPGMRDDALRDLVPARIERLADGLGIPLDRACAWGFVGAVLSEVWDAEDGGPVVAGRALDVALLLEPMLA